MGDAANGGHKDRVFCDLFGSPERKALTLSLYNALAGTSYDDPGKIEVTTLDDVVYLGMKNDVSFLVGSEMVLLEHQATPNPNMPLRGLWYFARLYQGHVERIGGNVYGTALLPLPRPRYVVLYNGLQELPDVSRLRLSDAWGSGGEPDLEVACTVYNVNAGRNPGLLGACPALAEYAHLVASIRANQARGMPLDQAVDEAVREQARGDGILSGYLKRTRAEVISMFMTEYDEEKQRALDRRDAFREGEAQGMARGIQQGLEHVRSRMEELGVDPALIEQVLQVERPDVA